MNIYGTPFVHGPHTISGSHATNRQQTFVPQQTNSLQSNDQVTLSGAAQHANQATESAMSGSEVRFDLVNRLRLEIASGTYETPEKLDIALEKMLVGIG